MRLPQCKWLLFALFATALTGCGSDAKPKAVPVSGSVMLKNKKPTSGALIVFHPTDPALEKRIGGKPMAKVGDDGKFSITSYAENDGAPPGEYGITVDWRAKPKAGGMRMGDGEGGSSGGPMLKSMYSNPQQPFMKVTVKAGEPNEFNIEIE